MRGGTDTAVYKLEPASLQDVLWIHIPIARQEERIILPQEHGSQEIQNIQVVSRGPNTSHRIDRAH
eukprot:988892-Pyramimonas_sp.AAC.1